MAVLHQLVAPFGFAARLDAKWSHFEQSTGEIVENGGITTLEFEFDFADGCDVVLVDGPDLALVDRRLDCRAWHRFDREDRAGDLGHEKRAKGSRRILRQA